MALRLSNSLRSFVPELRTFLNRAVLSPTLASNELVANHPTPDKIIHFGFGQSPFPVHPSLQTSDQHLKYNNYESTRGATALIDAVHAFMERKHGLDPDKYDVVVCPGSKLGLFALQIAIEGPTLIPVPSWVSYEPQCHLLDIPVVKFPLQLSDDGMYFDPVVMQKAVDSAPVKPTKMIINSPNNPTGLLIQNPNDVARFCQDNDIVMISDEIYDGVTSDSAWTTQAPLAPQHTIITTGLSKSFSLGGWRIGTLHIPKSMTGLANAIQTIASETWSAVPSPMQRVAINAYLPNPSLDAYVAECASIHHQVCTFLAKELRALGVSCPLHKGAFYIYPNFNSFRDALAQRGVQSSADLSTFLLTNYNIVSLPASAFGDEENLCLRLAVTAYDGQHALDLLRLDPNTPLDMTQAAPKVVKGAEYFGDFIRDLNQ
eukprot:m.199414 g.199414  ORF g.199414 m.199414 type:complete len:431 (-) comp14942_c0_seq3:392-1684(-)